MKKLLIAILALLMLTACGKQEKPVQPPVEEEAVIHTPVEQDPVVAQPEPEPVEIPTEIVEPEEPSPDETSEELFPMNWETTHVEGLIEDTVAYDLEQLILSDVDGAEVINQFYADLVSQLETHTKENVYPAVMEQHTGANVYGIMQAISWNNEWVEVEYQYKVEYLNGTAPEEFNRIDRFDVQTGEMITIED